MNQDDAEKIRLKRPRPATVRCASCAGMATCPQLHDDLWADAWRRFGLMAAEGHMQQEGFDDRRQLLCLECAERALGRRLTLEDLETCGGNYAHFVMQERAGATDQRIKELLAQPTIAEKLG